MPVLDLLVVAGVAIVAGTLLVVVSRPWRRKRAARRHAAAHMVRIMEAAREHRGEPYTWGSPPHGLADDSTPTPPPGKSLPPVEPVTSGEGGTPAPSAEPVPADPPRPFTHHQREWWKG